MDITKQNREYLTTTNRFIFNRLHKISLEKNAEISCTWCKYHRSENCRTKRYYYQESRKYNTTRKPLNGDYTQSFSCMDYADTWIWDKEYLYTIATKRVPNWKLISKFSKQWMKAKLKHIPNYYHIAQLNEDYSNDYDIKW